MSQTSLLLITKDPSHPLAHLALRYARAVLAQAELDVRATDDDATDHSDKNNGSKDITMPLKVFFYADAANIANRLRWQSADQTDLTQEWQALAKRYQLSLPVCVSTALSRGISDTDNSTRHQLHGDNLATGFDLVGLSELAMMMQSDSRLIQF